MSVSVLLSPCPVLQFLDNTGAPCIGGSLTTQVGGINYATYSESTGTTALPNPIPLNSRGEVSTAAGATTALYLQVGVSYTFILKDRAGNQLWSISGIYSPTTSNPIATGSANSQVIANTPPIVAAQGTLQWFTPVAANTGPATLNVDNNGAKNIFYLTKALVGGELQANVPTLAIYDGTQWNLAWSAKGPAADYYLDSGTVNAIAITVNQAQAVNTSGARYKVKIANTTTSSAALGTINGAGPWNFYLSDKVTLVPAGALVAGAIYDIIFDAGLAGFILENPSTVLSSFTATYSAGFSGSPTGTFQFKILPDGNTVQVWTPAAVTGTSNGNNFQMTGVPAAIQPAGAKILTLSLQDATGFAASGRVLIQAASGTWLYGNPTSVGFTASGLKGTQAGTYITYNLNT